MLKTPLAKREEKGTKPDMKSLGELRVLDFLQKTKGEINGRQMSDAKDRFYSATYSWREIEDGLLQVQRNGSSNTTIIPAIVKLPFLVPLRSGQNQAFSAAY